MTRKKKDTSHVVPGGKGFRCLNCGTEQGLVYPIDMNTWAGAAKGFTKTHRACKPSEAGAARFKYATPDEWLASWDTGTSSLTIFVVFTGRPVLGSEGSGVPHDPSDFGRCYRLLKVAPPEWRTNLQRVADRYPEWDRLVARWGELERLYEEELPTGRAPRLYALMRELVEAGRVA